MDSSTEEKNPYILDQKLFPNLKDNKIITVEFLEASKGVVQLVDKFGKFFSPLSYDMNGNIEKLEKCYQKNPSQFYYLENLLLHEDVNDSVLCVDALLWLKRALDFMLNFFQIIVNDKEKTESLQDHMTLAYSHTLEPYHGWVTKKLFRFFRRAVPDRTTLLSRLVKTENCSQDLIVDNLKNVYLQTLDVNISHINLFYKEHNLESDKKAP